jgi:hypothetical protein
MSKKQKLINGPSSCYRLEGTLEGVHKVLYLFGNSPETMEFETHCELWKSEHFVKYFVKTMSKTDKNINYDLFFELSSPQDDIFKDPKNNVSFHETYMSEFNKYFKSTIKIVDDKNMKSTDVINLNLHSNNIRKQKFGFDGILNFTLPNISTQINNIGLCTSYENLNNIYQYVNDLIIYLNTSINYDISLFYKTDKNEIEYVKKYMGDELFGEISNIINKIKYDYESENIKNKMANFIDNIITTNNIILKLCEDFINILNIILDKHKKDCGKYNGCLYDYDVHHKYVIPLIKICNKLYFEVINLYVIIASMNLLRKFLNKIHISNAIFYTTYRQTLCILYILVKKFDFKITHSTNKKIKIPKMTQLIKKHYNFSSFCEKTYQNNLYQCIDMSDFPDLFL